MSGVMISIVLTIILALLVFALIIYIAYRNGDKQKNFVNNAPFQVGEKFSYLGVEMLCTHNWEFEFECPPMNIVRADYVNQRGEIKHVVFYPNEFDNLKQYARKLAISSE